MVSVRDEGGLKTRVCSSIECFKAPQTELHLRLQENVFTVSTDTVWQFQNAKLCMALGESCLYLCKWFHPKSMQFLNSMCITVCAPVELKGYCLLKVGGNSNKVEKTVKKKKKKCAALLVLQKRSQKYHSR